MNQKKKYCVLAVMILVAGAVRLPMEASLTSELYRENLLPPRLEIGTGEKLGQTFSAVSLGGLRTLVATFLNIRAYSYFEKQRWSDVADTYDLIVDLAPRTKYYWDAGSWHLAYNAASHYLYESELPPLRRKLLWKSSILAGRKFLERGIQNNPDHPVLYERLGFLLADSNKVTAFGDPADSYAASYEAYKAAVDTGLARSFTKRAALYSLVRVPGLEKEALDLLLEIKRDQKKLQPTAMAMQYVLEYHQNPERPVIELVDEVFPSHKMAYQILGRLWMRASDRFPMHGAARAIRHLELEFGIQEEKSVLKRPIPPSMDPDDFFKK
jgi:tetratricopeptide (TPR) repeat protein